MYVWCYALSIPDVVTLFFYVKCIRRMLGKIEEVQVVRNLLKIFFLLSPSHSLVSVCNIFFINKLLILNEKFFTFLYK